MEQKEKNRKSLKLLLILIPLLAAVVAGGIFLAGYLSKNAAYEEALDMMENGKYIAAEKALKDLEGFRDSSEQIKECQYRHGLSLLEKGNYYDAEVLFLRLGDYAESKEQVMECRYQAACEDMENGDFQAALEGFLLLDDYSDSVEKASECRYQLALAAMERDDMEEALGHFRKLGDYRDSAELALECADIVNGKLYAEAMELMRKEQYAEAAKAFSEISDYLDAEARAEECTLRSTPEGRLRWNFEGKWIWVNSGVINPYDQYYEIDLQTNLITFYFCSPSTSFTRTFRFEVLSEKKLVAEGFRDSGRVYITREGNDLVLDYVNIDDAPSHNKAHWHLRRIGDGSSDTGDDSTPQAVIAADAECYPGTDFLTFSSCFPDRSPINESNTQGVYEVYYHNEPYFAQMSEFVHAYRDQYLEANFRMEEHRVRSYRGSSSYYVEKIYFDSQGNGVYISSGMSGTLTTSFCKAYVIPADKMQEFFEDYVVPYEGDGQ